LKIWSKLTKYAVFRHASVTVYTHQAEICHGRVYRGLIFARQSRSGVSGSAATGGHCIRFLHCLPKNVTTLACCNFKVHQPILITFGRNIILLRERVLKRYVICSAHQTIASALHVETESRKLRVFLKR